MQAKSQYYCLNLLTVQEREDNSKTAKIYGQICWLIQKRIVHLHPLKISDGGIAQLVRAHDS